MQTQGQGQDRTRATQGHLKEKIRQTRTHEDKPRTDLGQAKDKKDKKGLAKGSHRGKVQFYHTFFECMNKYRGDKIHTMSLCNQDYPPE